MTGQWQARSRRAARFCSTGSQTVANSRRYIQTSWLCARVCVCCVRNAVTCLWQGHEAVVDGTVQHWCVHCLRGEMEGCPRMKCGDHQNAPQPK